jgi:L-alanine-DL-glutamate epimerase-like enolase superfamily enzyme
LDIMPPRIAVRDIAFFERPVRFIRPFRFGAVVINAASQVFVRVEIEIEGQGNGKATSTGASAEMMVPKWFDKRPQLSPEQTVAELRRSLTIARELYLSHQGFETAFSLHDRCLAAQVEACAKEDIPPLAAAFGPAEIDKAILDALLRGIGVNFFDGMNGNIAGIDARLSPDLRNEDIAQFLARCRRLDRVAIRHTVGLDDRIEGTGGVADKHETTDARYFKLKLNGDPDADAARLTRIGNELATLPHPYSVTLDANEQYADLAALAALADRLDRDVALKPIATKLLYIEQPMPRDISRQSPLDALAVRDFIIDEADDSYDAFPAARELGYRGISSKSCKGIYKSIVNATRAAIWSTEDQRYFISGEDLTCQAGLGVQQDLALGALIGVTHAERNGHHYVDGFAEAPAAEARAFLAAHPDLYISDADNIRLSIHDGDLLTGSLTAPGFATGVHPDWAALSPLQQPKAKTLQEQSI